MLHGFSRKFKPVDILSDEEMQSIHRRALYVLEKTGMRIEHEKTYEGDWRTEFVNLKMNFV